MAEIDNNQQPQNNVPATINQRDITDNVLARVQEYVEAGALKLPEDYVPGNACRSAFLTLLSVEDKQGNKALSVCKKESIANALLEMVLQGLSPHKNQCYFVVHGDQLTMMRSYMGSITVAKRLGMKDIIANVVFQNDKFEYEVDSQTGRKKVLKHEQKMENIDNDKIRGGYYIITYDDGSQNMDVMTLPQIQKAWQMGTGYGKSKLHNNFTDEAVKKTLYNRGCKLVINTSSDSSIYEKGDEEAVDVAADSMKQKIKQNANTENLEFDEHEDLTNKPEVTTDAANTNTNNSEPNAESGVNNGGGDDKKDGQETLDF
jgi:recombination protein RecT